jgi:catechol 2,3-dioxygenase-like lactoylglutathione lyase family enzyme
MFVAKTHIHLGVLDTNRSAAFYQALLGAAPSMQRADMAVFELDSPPLSLTLEEKPRRGKAALDETAARASRETRQAPGADRSFALLVNEPRRLGAAAVALRRVGVQLRLEDQAIEARDPDGHEWRVRFVPSAPDRGVVTPGERR